MNQQDSLGLKKAKVEGRVMNTATTCNNCTGICSYNLVVFCNLIAFALKTSSKVNEYVLFWTEINLPPAGRELTTGSIVH